MIPFKDNKNKSALSTRWAQMSKQEQIIEKKKMEIQAKLAAQKQAAALAAQAKLAQLGSMQEGSSNIFSNDGSFMNQFKQLLEKQKQEKEEKDRIERENEKSASEEQWRESERQDGADRQRDAASSDIESRWTEDVDAESQWTAGGPDQQNFDNPNIPPLMNMPVRPPAGNSPSEKDHSSNQWTMPQGPPGFAGPINQDSGHNTGTSGPPAPSGPPGSNMGQQMPPNMPPMPPMPPGGQMPHGGPMHRGPMPPGMGPPGMGPPGMGGPHGPMPPFMGGPPNFPPMPPFMGPNGPNGPNGPMPPFFGSPFGPNGPMGPMGPNGPPPPPPPNSMMPPNSMNSGPNGNMPYMGPRPPFGPNGPPNFGNGNGPPNFGNGNNGPPNFGNGPPNFGNGNGPPNFGNGNGPPNFGNGNNGPPNFGNGPPNFGNGNGPPNMPPFMRGNNMPPNSMQGPDSKPDGPAELQNIPLPMTPTPPNIVKNEIDVKNIPLPPSNQVLLADQFPAAVQRAASEVARNGDHWENVLKAIHAQDQTMWFLHNTNSVEYQKFRQLVHEIRRDGFDGFEDKKPEVKPEDKYEPEFSLEDDDSNEYKYPVKDDNSSNADSNSQTNWNQQQYQSTQQSQKRSAPKREQASSQSDEEQEVKRERRKRKKSRWGEDPPVDVKPPALMGIGMVPPGMAMPGVIPPLPPAPPLPAGVPQLAKIDQEGMKLSTVNRNNQALMQYATTNYGTTNLSAEDWKKCEDNFKLNLLYQDMLKKRQEVERLAAAGKHKYEYDSDEDTAEGTWEHKLRSNEMNATARWADELTKQAAGKHHIGDFLPPEELKKFMEKYSAVKSGKEPDLSDYKEFKLKEDNLGFKMLQKLGWSEGQGLGAEGSGIVDPINKANQPVANLGLGAGAGDGVSPDDDEFDAYRKRMMLAYRFRPNPLNNPRRPYY